MQLQPFVHSGNAQEDGAQYRQWLLGGFIPGTSPQHSAAVELKFGTHITGECRSETNATSDPTKTTVAILISGKVQFNFPKKCVVLEKQGDYVLFGPNILHWWHINENAIVVTIRWEEPADN